MSLQAPLKKLICLLLIVSATSHGAVASPPNSPAKVQWNASQGALKLTYHGTVVLDAVVTVRDKDGGEASGLILMKPEVDHISSDPLKMSIVRGKSDKKIGIYSKVIF